MILEKKKIREIIKTRVSELSEEYIQYSDAQICRRILELDEYKKAKTIFCFVGRDIEINTLPIINDAVKNGKTVVIPRCIAKRIMQVFEFTKLEDLELSKFGILEPKPESRLVEAADIDFSILPCMTANKQAHRLGYGGGFYDTFFESLKSFTCVICREKLLYDNIPLEAHDMLPNMLITETAVYPGSTYVSCE